MTARSNCLIVLLADDDANDLITIRRVLQPMEDLVRLVMVSDGNQAIAYLQGENQFADRRAWPLPDVLLLGQHIQGPSGLDVLFWARTEPRYALLPAVVFGGRLTAAQTDVIERLNGVICPNGADARRVQKAVSSAVQSAVKSTRRARITAGQPTPSPLHLVRTPEYIRVWT